MVQIDVRGAAGRSRGVPGSISGLKPRKTGPKILIFTPFYQPFLGRAHVYLPGPGLSPARTRDPQNEPTAAVPPPPRSLMVAATSQSRRRNMDRPSRARSYEVHTAPATTARSSGGARAAGARNGSPRRPTAARRPRVTGRGLGGLTNRREDLQTKSACHCPCPWRTTGPG